MQQFHNVKCYMLIFQKKILRNVFLQAYRITKTQSLWGPRGDGVGGLLLACMPYIKSPHVSKRSLTYAKQHTSSLAMRVSTHFTCMSVRTH
jgi:hypothetical protein